MTILSRRNSLSMLLTSALLACLAFGPASASALSKSGSVTVKAPRCQKGSTAMITITSKPTKDRFVVAIGAYMGARPGKPGNKALALQTYVHLKRRARQASPALPLGVSRSISVLVNVGQRIYVATDFGGPTAIEAGAAYTALTVRKCAVPKFTG